MDFPIGELARRTGLNPSAIRYWERVGVLAEPLRARGRRLYGEEAVRSVRLVQLGQQAGFTLAEIRRLRTTEWRSQGWTSMLRAKKDEVGRRAARLARMDALLERALGCGCRAVGGADCVLAGGEPPAAI